MHTSNKMHSLTILRFLAAAVVVIFHFGKETSFYSSLPPLLSAGPLMVTFFFVLSGFVLSVSSSDNQPNNTLKFYINRLSRILPIYFVAAAAFFLCSWNSPFSAEYIPLLLAIQAWIPTYALLGNSPAWSISVEIFFYAMTPALIAISKNDHGRSWRAWLIGALVFWATSQACLVVLAQPPIYEGYPSASHELLYYFPVSHLCSFVLGFSSGIAFKSKILLRTNKALLLSVAFVAAALANYVRGNIQEINDAIGYTIPFGSSFLAILFLPIIYLIATAERSSNLRFWPWLILLGEASYSMYILQLPTYIAFDKLLPSHSYISPDLRFGIFFLTLTVVSVVSYKLIEVPARDAIKRKYADVEKRKLPLANSR